MTDRSSLRQPSTPHRQLRPVLVVLAALLLLSWLVPPLASLAHRYEYVEALQFSFFVLVVPGLFVMGAPWSRLGLASPSAQLIDEDGKPLVPSAAPGPVDRLAGARRRHPEASRAALFGFVYVAAGVFWRVPMAVDALTRHHWLVVVEAVTLAGAGAGLWLELVESPPLSPRMPRPRRIAMAAIAMWLIWVLAYLVGLSHGSWYHAYPHHAGTGISVSADQQVTTGVMWLVSACAFIPVVYWNLIRWLQSEENPDEELHTLVRQEHTRGRTVDPGLPPG